MLGKKVMSLEGRASPCASIGWHVASTVIALYWTAATYAEFATIFRVDEPLMPYMCVLNGLVIYVCIELLRTRRPKLVGIAFWMFVVYLFIKSCILHGTHYELSSYDYDDFRSDVTCLIVTTARNKVRLQTVQARLSQAGMGDCDVIYGEDSSKYKTASDVSPEISGLNPIHAANLGQITYTVMMRQVFAKYASTMQTKWLLVFEDDARLLPDFTVKVPRAVNYYRNSDVIWLDARNTLAWTFLYGSVVGGTTATMFSRESLSRLSEAFVFSDEMFTRFRDVQPGMPGVQVDAYLAYACNHGRFNCGFAPLVAEACGIDSTLYQIHTKDDKKTVEERKNLR